RDDRLGGEVEHGRDLELAEHALEELLVADVAPHHLHPLEEAAPRGLALGYPVAHQADDVGLRVEEPADEPASHEARGAGHEGRTVLPELVAHVALETMPAASAQGNRRSQ